MQDQLRSKLKQFSSCSCSRPPGGGCAGAIHLIHLRRRRPIAGPTTQQPGREPGQETDTVTDDSSSTGNTQGAGAPHPPSPKLTIDLSDPEAIARTAHEVAVALAEGRLSGRAGQAIMTAIRLAIEARKPAPPPPPPPPDRGPLIRLDLLRPDRPS
jgi:hypothetical protein